MSHQLPYRWSLDHNPLSGVTFGRWCSLLRENRFAINPGYAHRALFLTAMSVFNSACHAIERLRYGRALECVYVRPDPIFIVGHWRSGTTHLHNLLSLDPRLTYPTTFQAVNPFSFLTTEHILPRLFAPLLPDHRPMDNMAMSFDAPQEDELALSLLCGLSPYLSLSFPGRAAAYDRYLTFADASPREVALWKQTFLHLTRKLSLRDPRPIVFKSPAHTARLRLLLELFPKARFVHIHRDPYQVFQSSRHYFHTAAWHANLQPHDPAGFDEAILNRYDTLYDTYLEQRRLIPPGQLHELAYADLVADPVGELRRLYARLNMGAFNVIERRVRAYRDSLAGYRKNSHQGLSQGERRRVASRWHRYFQAFGYRTGFEPFHTKALPQEVCA